MKSSPVPTHTVSVYLSKLIIPMTDAAKMSCSSPNFHQNPRFMSKSLFFSKSPFTLVASPSSWWNQPVWCEKKKKTIVHGEMPWFLGKTTLVFFLKSPRFFYFFWFLPHQVRGKLAKHRTQMTNLPSKLGYHSSIRPWSNPAFHAEISPNGYGSKLEYPDGTFKSLV